MEDKAPGDSVLEWEHPRTRTGWLRKGGKLKQWVCVCGRGFGANLRDEAPFALVARHQRECRVWQGTAP